MSEFAEIKRRLNLEMSVLNDVRIKILQLIRDLRDRGKSTLRPGDISVYMGYIECLKKDEKKRETMIERIENELDRERAELMEAVKKRKILEIVKEKKLQDYKVALNEREKKELDELGILNSNRSE